MCATIFEQKLGVLIQTITLVCNTHTFCLQVSQEFDRVMGLNDSMEIFVEEWRSNWIKAIFAVAKEEEYIANSDSFNDMSPGMSKKVSFLHVCVHYR